MLKNTDDKTACFFVIVSQDVYEQVLKMAKEHDLSVAWVVRYVITDFLKNDRKITIGLKDDNG